MLKPLTVERRFFVESTLSARINSIEARMASLEGKVDLLIGKVADMDTRLIILENRTERG